MDVTERQRGMGVENSWSDWQIRPGNNRDWKKEKCQKSRRTEGIHQ